MDSVQNGAETGPDCGGGTCPTCGSGFGCTLPSDCASGVCTGNVCQPPLCTDGVTNGTETDTDCGGPSCPSCPVGETCSQASDCTSGVCIGNVCQPPSCTDGVQNGAESDQDCGGTCPGCDPGEGCNGPTDCTSGVCSGNVCQAPTCSDDVQNGTETGVDCGGLTCGGCGGGQPCAGGSDCASGSCSSNVCNTCPTGMSEIPILSGTGSYCIDRTETRASSYAAFLLDTMDNTNGQPSYCSWNDTFVPATGGGGCTSATFDPIGNPNKPAVCVDWCDARAYCQWAGKRLCGKIGGGTNDFDWVDHAGTSQWFNSCSNGDTSSYPYGNTFSAPTCNEGAAAVDVGTFPGCVGTAPPFSTVFDASGNIREWEDSCQNFSGSGDKCRTRGGDFANNANDLRCDEQKEDDRDDREGRIGFRCCSELPAAGHCGDGVLNNDETSADCGGSCPPCGSGKACATGNDCASGVCAGTCQGASCSDNILNGNETDQDCGGSCPNCPNFDRCLNDNDCQSDDCSNGTCVD